MTPDCWRKSSPVKQGRSEKMDLMRLHLLATSMIRPQQQRSTSHSHHRCVHAVMEAFGAVAVRRMLIHSISVAELLAVTRVTAAPRERVGHGASA